MPITAKELAPARRCKACASHPSAARASDGSDATSAAKSGHFGDVTMWATRRAGVHGILCRRCLRLRNTGTRPMARPALRGLREAQDPSSARSIGSSAFHHDTFESTTSVERPPFDQIPIDGSTPESGCPSRRRKEAPLHPGVDDDLLVIVGFPRLSPVLRTGSRSTGAQRVDAGRQCDAPRTRREGGDRFHTSRRTPSDPPYPPPPSARGVPRCTRSSPQERAGNGIGGSEVPDELPYHRRLGTGHQSLD